MKMDFCYWRHHLSNNPNQYKIWKNGDINNYQELIEITETDLSKNIYVYNFNDSQMQLKPVHYFLFII